MIWPLEEIRNKYEEFENIHDTVLLTERMENRVVECHYLWIYLHASLCLFVCILSLIHPIHRRRKQLAMRNVECGMYIKTKTKLTTPKGIGISNRHIMPQMRTTKDHILDKEIPSTSDWKYGLAQGVTFYGAHSTPLCSPSRYMLLSWNYAHIGQFLRGTCSITSEQQNSLKCQKSIAEALKQGGNCSTSIMYGTWHIGCKIPLTKKRIIEQ